MKLKKIKYLIGALVLSIVVFSLNPVQAGFDISVSAGVSGFGIIAVAADVLGETDGEFTAVAAEYGLLTGDFALGFDIHSQNFGLRIEGLFGYYKYTVFEIPNTAYAMVMVAAEPYIRIGDIILGIGGGFFWGLNWEDVLGITVSPYHSLRGFGLWPMIGFRGDSDIVELNFRFKWHYFIDQNARDFEESEKLTNDYIFLIRLSFFITII